MERARSAWPGDDRDDHRIVRAAMVGARRGAGARGFPLQSSKLNIKSSFVVGAATSGYCWAGGWADGSRSEEHTSELQSLMRISYAVFCLTKNKSANRNTVPTCNTK